MLMSMNLKYILYDFQINVTVCISWSLLVCVLFLLYIFWSESNFVIIVNISPIEFLSNANNERQADQEAHHHRPVHPGVADLLEEEHAEVDDADHCPEESHHARHDALSDRVSDLSAELQEERRAGVVDGAAGDGGDVELRQGDWEDLHDQQALPTIETEGHTQTDNDQFPIGAFHFLRCKWEDECRDGARHCWHKSDVAWWLSPLSVNLRPFIDIVPVSDSDTSIGAMSKSNTG